jgi:NAD(P)H-hydrate epimerase
MPLPAPLLRNNPRLSKKDFGHLLIMAGSPTMLGAAALSSLSAMRSGAGLVTTAVPEGSNLALQKKIAHVVMTQPLAQSKAGFFSLKAYFQVKKIWEQFDALAIGPGIGRESGTLQLARLVIIHCPKPLVIDADALFALAGHTEILLKAKAPRVLTPHPGEMARLLKNGDSPHFSNREKTAKDFARRFKCVLLLKGQHTVIASPEGNSYINKTGNVGMATAGSGDVLTGMIAAFLAQGIAPYEAACWGAHLHGAAGDRAAKLKFKTGLIATDLIESIPYVIKKSSGLK